MPKTTDKDPELIIFFELDFSISSIAVPIVMSVTLAVCFLCCFPAYIHAYWKHLGAHRMSPLFPLVHLTFYFISFGYVIFFILGICGAALRLLPPPHEVLVHSLNILVIVSVFIFNYLGFYQMVISLFSIRDYLSTKFKIGNIIRSNVKIIIVILYFLLLVKDSIWIYQFVVLVTYAELELAKTHLCLYFKIYSCQQSVLILALTLDFIKTNSENCFHSEVSIASQLKRIGTVKGIMGILWVLSFMTNFYLVVASISFFTVDFFLVPFIFEAVEINSDPNKIKPIEVKKIPVK